MILPKNFYKDDQMFFHYSNYILNMKFLKSLIQKIPRNSIDLLSTSLEFRCYPLSKPRKVYLLILDQRIQYLAIITIDDLVITLGNDEIAMSTSRLDQPITWRSMDLVVNITQKRSLKYYLVLLMQISDKRARQDRLWCYLESLNTTRNGDLGKRKNRFHLNGLIEGIRGQERYSNGSEKRTFPMAR